MKRITLFIFFITLAVCSFFAVRSFAGLGGNATEDTTEGKRSKLMQYLAIITEKGHFDPPAIDNTLSTKIFVKYINSLDGARDIFLKKDIEEFIPYALEIDEEMSGKKDVTFFAVVDKVFRERVIEADSMRTQILANKFDYTLNDSFLLPEDEDGIKFNIPQQLSAETIAQMDVLQMPTSLADKQSRWYKKLKGDCLPLYFNAKKQEEDKRKKDTAYKKWASLDSLELDARKNIAKRYDRFFNRIYKHFNEDKRFDLFLNSIMTALDPHSGYFSPVDARSYEENTSGKFYGIGALLTSDDQYVKIVNVSAGGAAWKSKQVDNNDIILKVKNEGQDSAVDIVGYETTEAVKLIRGDKGTKVTLTLKKVDGSIKEVTLVRDKIFINQTFARSGVVNYKGEKIGYIYLPEFYNSVEKEDGQNPESYADMKRELEKLKAQKVKGIIVDLRNNGGGYLIDAIKIAGLFIPKGPVVQVRDKQDAPEILEDVDSSVVYNGPLMLITNEYSASASEIVAAALQDYQRAIIVGTSSTFGKGTVQRGNLSLGQLFGDSKDLGTLNLTIQKFYRINGKSTQLKGVRPDVVLPSVNDYLPVREKDMPFAIAYDSIATSKFKAYNPQKMNYPAFAKTVSPIVAKSRYYNFVTDYGKYLSSRQLRPIPLNMDRYKQELDERERYNKKIDSMRGKIDSISVRIMKEDSARYVKMDTTESEVFFQWYKGLNKDVTLIHAVDIFNHMLRQGIPQKSTNNKKPQTVAWLDNTWLLPKSPAKLK